MVGVGILVEVQHMYLLNTPPRSITLRVKKQMARKVSDTTSTTATAAATITSSIAGSEHDDI